MNNLEFSPYLLEKIGKGEAILFLGAGASMGAEGPDDLKALSGESLKLELCRRFLGGESTSRNLQYVGELVKAQAGVLELQRAIAALFGPLEPTVFHHLITRFKWRAVVTTNYDRLVEKAYLSATKGEQTLYPLISDADDFQAVLNDPRGLPLVKLHGTVERADDTATPFILSSFEYHKYLDNRRSLFKYLQEAAQNSPIVFAGYDIGDESIKEILFDIYDKRVPHPIFALVTPATSAQDTHMWGKYEVLARRGTFADLMEYLTVKIPDITIRLATARSKITTPITRFISSSTTPSALLSDYLEAGAQFIYEGMPSTVMSAQEFFHGLTDAWGWLSKEYDILRPITEALVADCERDRGNGVIVELVQGYAGSGKSVSARRLCWTLAGKNRPVLFINDEGQVRVDCIVELGTLFKERLFIIVDDVLPHMKELVSLVREARRVAIDMTIIAYARTNEWNVEGEPLLPYVDTDRDLLDLSPFEIRALVSTLRRHDSLGYLTSMSDEEAVEHLQKALQRQMLVALHQISFEGKSFEEIIEDEYDNIVPRRAQNIYLDVCTLHRLGAPVRAGFITRVTGVDFERFKEEFLKPLEHVVKATDREVGPIKDYAYRTRHPDIAEIAFNHALRIPEERAHHLVRIVRCLNPAYTSDEFALTAITRGKTLADMFDDKSLAHLVIDAAGDAGMRMEIVEQHRASLELHHPRGNIREALSAIDRAIRAAKGNPSRSTRHVKATILRRFARDVAVNNTEKALARSEATSILNRLIRDRSDQPSLQTKASLAIDEFEESLCGGEESGANTGSTLLKAAESALQSLRIGPVEDSVVAEAEARVAEVLNDSPKALRILEAANRKTPGNPQLSVRLARQYRYLNRNGEAIELLRKTSAVNGGNKDVHFELALLLMSERAPPHVEIIDRLRRSFSDGDSRYAVRYQFARCQFLHGDRARGKLEFEALSKTSLPPNLLTRIRSRIMTGENSPERFTGSVKTLRDGYCFVATSTLGDIFAPAKTAGPAWSELVVGQTVSMEVGFCYRGPQGLNLQRMT